MTSPSPLEHVPENVGVASFSGEVTAAKATTGAAVSITKVRVALVPVLPAASVCLATAVDAPSSSAAVVTEYAPSRQDADRVNGVGPATEIVTGPSPVEQLPDSVGVASFDGVGNACNVTRGGVESITNDRVVLVSLLPAASVWLATAV
jgi:hypothetical protein